MSATEFTKNKVHFTIGLLAALFALHPFFEKFDRISFDYMGVAVPLSYAFMTIGVFLALAVYFYATDLMSEQPSPVSQRIGNYLYALAVMTVPFYAGMYASTLLENYLIEHGTLNQYHIKAPVLTVGILVTWVIIWQVGGLTLRKYLTKKDWTSRIDQLTDKEMDALKRARELMDAQHADLAIVQFHKAVQARLKMACMKRGYFKNNVVNFAKKSDIINVGNVGLFEVIQKHFSVAESTTPVKPDALIETEHAVKHFLATIPV